MNVVFIPYNKKNPYQTLLSNSLKERGVGVFEPPPVKFFLLTRSFLLKKRPIIHLHWLDYFLIHNHSLLISLIKSILFTLDLLIAKALGAKIVWTMHNIENHENQFTKIERIFTKFSAIFFDKVIVMSKYAKREAVNKLNIEKIIN